MSPESRYRIVQRLGQGGMAEVFQAELVGELGFVRKVAIKRLLPEVATDGSSAQRFLDEARIASQLHHVNIVSVLDFGLLDELPFQVLELVDGIDVEQLQQRAGGTLPLDVALTIATEVAHALDHAHTARDANDHLLGIVHRDVKPSNVLVSWAGDVKLTDFGIAVARDRLSKTEAGAIAGTFGFMAPEQRLRSEIDGRTDVFSLGLTLYAMIVGSSPLRDITVEIALLAGDPIPLSPDLPADIATIIARAIAPSRSDRPSAAELALQLEAVVRGRVTTTPRSHLRGFLAQFVSQRAAPGVLDALLGYDVEVVPAGNAPGEPRKYALRPTVAGRRAPVPPAPSHRMRTWLAGALGAISLAVVAIWIAAGYRDHSAGPAPLIAGSAKPGMDASTADAQPPPVVAAREQPASDPHPPRAPVKRAPPIEPARPPPKEPTTPPSGFLQIVGEVNIGALVIVDGRSVGYAPNKLGVPVGHHHVAVERKDGSTTTVDVDITEYNSLAHPARPTL